MAFGDLNKIFSTAGLCSFSADARISLGRPQFARHGRRGTFWRAVLLLHRCISTRTFEWNRKDQILRGGVAASCFGVFVLPCTRAAPALLAAGALGFCFEFASKRATTVFFNGFLSFVTFILCFYALDAPTALCNRRAWSRNPVIRRLFRSSGPRHAHTRPQFSDSRLC